MYKHITTLGELEDESSLVWGKVMLTVKDVVKGESTSTVTGWFYEGWCASGELLDNIIAQRWTEDEECEELEFPYDDTEWHGDTQRLTLELANAEWLVPGARVLLSGVWRLVRWEGFEETVARGMDGPVVTQDHYSATEVHAYSVFSEKWGTPRAIALA